MTPAIQILKKKKKPYIIHEYGHDSNNNAYGVEAAEKLSVAKERVFKTLVVSLNNNDLIVAIIPVSSMLSMKYIAKYAGAKKAEMALPKDVERATGYVLGGVSPLGQKKNLKTFIDVSAQDYATIYVSGGRRGMDIELSPEDLCLLVKGDFAGICQ